MRQLNQITTVITFEEGEYQRILQRNTLFVFKVLKASKKRDRIFQLGANKYSKSTSTPFATYLFFVPLFRKFLLFIIFYFQKVQTIIFFVLLLMFSLSWRFFIIKSWFLINYPKLNFLTFGLNSKPWNILS